MEDEDSVRKKRREQDKNKIEIKLERGTLKKKNIKLRLV
jgi:hypothetical protein